MSRNPLEIQHLDPKRLIKNSWNPNVVDPINQDKIEESLRTIGFFKPVLCRELEDGSLEILGGEHRVEAAINLEMSEVPVINLGQISELEAKKMTLLDNGRYGEDDPEKMAELLVDMGSTEELLSILAINEAELASYFEHSTITGADFDSFLEEDEDAGKSEINLASAVSDLQTHAILRFKVTVEDASLINDMISKVKSVQGFVDSDDLSNSGNALVHLLRGGK